MNAALGILALLRRPKPRTTLLAKDLSWVDSADDNSRGELRSTLAIAEDWTCTLAGTYAAIYEAERAVDNACETFGAAQHDEADRHLADAARWIEHARAVNREAARR